MYLLKFAGGLEKEVSDDYAHKLDDLWDQDPEGKKFLRFKDGTKVLLSTLVEMLPKRNMASVSDTQLVKETTAKIMGYLEASDKGQKSKVKEWWIEKTKENIQRIKDGKKWIHYDKEGNEYTQEQAELSIMT